MQVSVESTGALERRMEVQVPAERVEKAVDERLQRMSRTVRLKGFRPGKVPVKVVRQQFGQHAVARGDVEHVAGVEQRQRAARERLPGAAGRVVALHVAGHRIRPGRNAAAGVQDLRDARPVLRGQGVFSIAAQYLPQAIEAGVAAGRGDAVVDGHALAAIGVARHLGASWLAIEAGLAEFSGIDRRFEKIGEAGDDRVEREAVDSGDEPTRVMLQRLMPMSLKLAIGAAVVFSSDRPEPVAIDPSKLPPGRAGASPWGDS